MKFISTKAINGKPLQIDMAFDSGLLKSITPEDEEGYYTLMYDLSALVISPPQIEITDSIIVAKITHENIYLSAILYADLNQETHKYEQYFKDGLLDCKLELSSAEREKLFIAIIQLLASGI